MVFEILYVTPKLQENQLDSHALWPKASTLNQINSLKSRTPNDYDSSYEVFPRETIKFWSYLVALKLYAKMYEKKKKSARIHRHRKIFLSETTRYISVKNV